MTFKELFLIKDPCDTCLVGPACRMNKIDCENHLKYLQLIYRRTQYWKKNYGKLIWLTLMVSILSTLIITGDFS